MGIRKLTADLTFADGGTASEDVAIRGPVGRWYGLHSVVVTSDEVKKGFSITIYEVDLDDTDDDGVDEEFYGEQLFFIADPFSGKAHYPRLVSVDEDGQSTDEENILPMIGSRQLRVEANGGTDGGTATVNVYVQTSGDTRF